jgi:predicted aconitase with swiveling domain
MQMKGRAINPGRAEGEAIVSSEPVGFYGNIDPKTGIVIEKGHPLEGQCIKGKVFVFPCGKGSTVGPYVIYGLKANGVAPAAIINKETETIVATGVILADIPCIDGIDIAKIKTGDRVAVEIGEKDGTVEIK